MFGFHRKSTPPHPECLPVKLPSDLLAPHSRMVREIQQLVGVPQAHWQALYQDALLAYTNYVQLMPASEAHHHAVSGGLLRHGLEVVLHALRLRRAHLLPQGADTEEIVAKRDVWTYAVFSAALLHDIGKPLMDQIITCFDQNGKEIGPWDALTAPMSANSWYRIRFRREREYGLHEQVAPLLTRLIIPSIALTWLAADRGLLATWLAAVNGTHEEAGILGEIIQQADGLSVAADLGASTNTTRLPGTRQPLHERLLTGLRYLLNENQIPLNRNGAAAWFDGERLWLVSKRGIDTLREHLTQEGHTGIPSRNDRIFDELQQNGILIPNGDRAIWKATVSGDNWSHTLTFICLPATRLWPNSDSRPDIFEGTITPHEVMSNSETGTDDSIISRGTPQQSDQSHAHEIPTQSEPDTTDLPVTSTSGFDPIAYYTVTSSPNNQQTRNDASPAPDHHATANDPDTENDPGQAFAAWLHEGLKHHRFETNSTNARIHSVKEGLLLISPGIFKDFDRENWNLVQKRFQKLKLHKKTSQGTNIHIYQVTGKRKKSRLNGILIEDPEQLFEGIVLPPANSHLTLSDSVS
ncbi:MAG: TraI domain-containing protein [Gammaproteobacteria bacterium]|nr:TraI domain-containing protein [Gammaproteobacteria bacterium]MDH5651280.1 TraI domain-containing protein [Gammaproteobacteria bacterium]